VGKSAELDWMMEIITPKIPNAEPKISTIRIFTNNDGSCASASAHPLPATPTQMLHVGRRGLRRRVERYEFLIEVATYPDAKFVKPTDTPLQKIAYPANVAAFIHVAADRSGTPSEGTWVCNTFQVKCSLNKHRDAVTRQAFIDVRKLQAVT
jgi:hypothetical protein